MGLDVQELVIPQAPGLAFCQSAGFVSSVLTRGNCLSAFDLALFSPGSFPSGVLSTHTAPELEVVRFYFLQNFQWFAPFLLL